MPLNSSSIEGIIWDLDNTLYRFTDAFYKSCTEAAAEAAQELGINLSYEDTLKLAERSEKEHGYSMHGYVSEHGLTYASLHFPFHQKIDETVIDPIDGMAEALQDIKLPQVILTNASRCWAARALKFVGLDHLFENGNIIAMEDADFEPKSSSDKGFKLALQKLNLPAESVLMVDDLDRNLEIPHKMGMQTIFMNYGDAMQNLPDFIDGQYQTAVELSKIF